VLLVESSAGDDGDASLEELPEVLTRAEVDVHGEEKVLSGGVEIDGELYLVLVISFGIASFDPPKSRQVKRSHDLGRDVELIVPAHGPL